jgi:hypothetical protein
MQDHEESEAIVRGEDSGSSRHGRASVAAKLEEYDFRTASGGKSQRRFAAETGVPRATIQAWLLRRRSLAASPKAVAFFESPEGLAFLHSFVVAAHLVMTWMGPCGIRLVGLLIELTGLGPFIASSYGSQQRISAEMQEALAEYGAEERARLGAAMEQKKITVCEDETFLSEDICLVAKEPVSDFILLEEYAEKRDAATWNAAMGAARQGLKVEVVQSTSDEAAALLSHAESLGAAHSPDLFHVQNEVGQAMALALLARETRAGEAHERARSEVERQVEAERAYWESPKRTGRPPGFAQRIERARADQEEAARHLDSATEHRIRWRVALHGIERAYHPFDLATGAPRPAALVDEDLCRSFDELEAIAGEAGLSESSKGHLAKARRVVPKMTATAGFFHDEVHRRVETLGLPPDQEELLLSNLIPAAYLQRVAAKTQDRDRKAETRKTMDELLSAARFPGTFAASLSDDQRRDLEKAAYACADVFQRSSSCLEGRNGRLSQFEHAMRRLHPKKLAGLTVIHNYFAKRPDGTTAAERFFGMPPRDLFAWLVNRIPLPPRPASPRQSGEKQGLFQPT